MQQASFELVRRQHRTTTKPGDRHRTARFALVVVATGLLASGWSHSVVAQQPLKKLLVLDFQLIDQQEGVVPFPEKETRMAMASQRLRDALAREKLYDVIDNAPVAQSIRTEAARQNLLECNGCELDIARQAGADRVLLAWVQKVSNLILNINVKIRDANTGQVVMTNSVDLRGNTDQSWQRAIDFMVREMVEKQQGNR